MRAVKYDNENINLTRNSYGLSSCNSKCRRGHTWATGGGGWGGEPIPSPKAKKNKGPSKKCREERRKLKAFLKISLFFAGFKVRSSFLFCKKSLAFSFSCFGKNPSFLQQKFFLSPLPCTPPLEGEKVSPPLEPFWGVLQFLKHPPPLWKKVGAHVWERACLTKSERNRNQQRL